MSAKTVVQETVTNGPGMISGAHPGVKTENTPLDQWRTLDVQSNSNEKDRNYTGGNSCGETPSGCTPLACGARDRKGLVCVCCVWCVVCGVWCVVCGVLCVEECSVM